MTVRCDWWRREEMVRRPREEGESWWWWAVCRVSELWSFHGWLRRVMGRYRVYVLAELGAGFEHPVVQRLWQSPGNGGRTSALQHRQYAGCGSTLG